MDAFTRLESSITVQQVSEWCSDNFIVPVVLCLLYLTAIYLGRRWMRFRKPYSLRRELAVWNALLALFSMVAFMKTTPLMLKKLSEGGFVSSVCSNMENSSTEVFWLFVFVLSKIVEFGDTAFVVLRKSPLMFLHWYHHITVCLFTWYGGAVKITDSTGHWFCWMNCAVHSAMYTYYLFKSLGLRLPKLLSTCVTALQLVQFAVGVSCVLIAWWTMHNGMPCNTSVSFNRLGLLLYGSYLVLFARFFYNRYLR